MVICDKCVIFLYFYMCVHSFALEYIYLCSVFPCLCFSFLICSISVLRSPSPHLSSIRSKREKEVAKKVGPEILKPLAQQINAKIREIGSSHNCEASIGSTGS